MGFELNPDYADMIEKRLSKEFFGFDSIDERINRRPMDSPEDKKDTKNYLLEFDAFQKGKS